MMENENDTMHQLASVADATPTVSDEVELSQGADDDTTSQNTCGYPDGDYVLTLGGWNRVVDGHLKPCSDISEVLNCALALLNNSSVSRAKKHAWFSEHAISGVFHDERVHQ